MLHCLFIVALWSPARKDLTSWLSSVCFIVVLSLSRVVSCVMRGTSLYRFLIFASLLTLGVRFESSIKFNKHVLDVFNKTKRLIGMINRTCMKRNMFLTISTV